MTVLCHYLDSLLVAIITTTGAAIPVLVLMLFHYKLRKKSYKDRIERTKFQIASYEAFRDSDSSASARLFKSYNVQDISELAQAFEGTKMSVVQKNLLIQAALKRTENIFKYQDQINNLRAEIKYLEEYSLSTYFGSFLDKKFSGI